MEHTNDNHQNEIETNGGNDDTKPKNNSRRHFSFKEVDKSNKIIAFATVIISVMTILQFCAMRKSDETSRLRDRAFLIFHDPIVQPYPNEKNPVEWAITIITGNLGNMPARRISSRCAWFDAPINEDIEDPWKLAKNWKPMLQSSVIGPKQNFGTYGGEIPVKTYETVKNFTHKIYIMVEVKYIDGFDFNKIRITQMSRIWTYDQYGKYSFRLTPGHNCTDDDCHQQ